MKSSLIFLLVCLSTPLQAKNYALFFSGDDAEKGDQNQFLEEYKTKTTEFDKSGWETQILYGDENESKFLLGKAPKLEGKVKPATKENVFEWLDAMIKNGASGDQVLLNLNGHGAMSGYFQLAGGDFNYNDPEILDRLKQLNDKGIKLAIALDTCYGGSAIPPLSPYACVVASQTSNSVSYSGPPAAAFNKLLKQTKPATMNDYYLQLLYESTNRSRMVPMSTASFNNDYLARVTTGLFRKDTYYATEPNKTCYGPEAMEKFEKGFSPILQMLNADQKYKKICKIFGPEYCKKPAQLASSIKKLKVKDLDIKSEELEKLSDSRIDTIVKCNQIENSVSFTELFTMKLDFTGIATAPNEYYPVEWMADNLGDRANGIYIEKGFTKSGSGRILSFRGSLCDMGSLIGPESISDLANFYAKQLFIAPQYNYKANTEAELATKLKKMFNKALSKTLSPEQKVEIEKHKDLVKEKYLADKKYLTALTKQKEILQNIDMNTINQALAYNFLDEADHVPEGDKVGRQKCEDFKLK